MSESSPYRVMWLLNHTAARNFEIPMLKSIGIREIYTPKIFPLDIGFRSASIDYSEDSTLTVPKDILDRFNSVNWYESASGSDWALASEYFDVCFFIAYDVDAVKVGLKNFTGLMLWRVYGLDESLTYSKVLSMLTLGEGERWIKNIGNRFFFAQAYSHLNDVESRFLSSKALYLPLGMHSVDVKDQWQGSNARILFVCPDIAFNSYYKDVYREFVKNFGNLPYSIGGAQPLMVDDPNVLGFLPIEEHQKNMREMRLMFYHSQEKYHIHYHPFEAIRAGMPLLFMAGGMLDRLGGAKLPGRCRTMSEAQKKAKRLLDGDPSFIESIRSTQTVLLEAMRPSTLRPHWYSAFERLGRQLAANRRRVGRSAPRPKRIAIILPVAYKGGSLRGAKLLAEAIRYGSVQAGEQTEVVFLYLQHKSDYSEEDFSDLHPSVKRRAFRWKSIGADEARRAMRYAGYENWEPSSERYSVIDDGIKQLQDCDLWLIVSDRLVDPILPLRPVVYMIYDYLQRYFPIIRKDADKNYLSAVRAAERVFVTTDFTFRDALQYAGVAPRKLVKLPMLAPSFDQSTRVSECSAPDYFVWTTNAAMHKNHARALQALRIYYRQLEGELRCLITGVGTDSVLKSPPAHMKKTIASLKSDSSLNKRLTWCGNLPDMEYKDQLSAAAFLWHPGSLDNGTFSVIEAASLGVPSLSSDYPAMREIDRQFALNLAWADANSVQAMARALKDMERTYKERRDSIPTPEVLATQGVCQLAGEYWKAIRECL